MLRLITKEVDTIIYDWYVKQGVPYPLVYKYSIDRYVEIIRRGRKKRDKRYHDLTTFRDISHDKLITATYWQYLKQQEVSSKVSIWHGSNICLLFEDNIRKRSSDETIYRIDKNIGKQEEKFEHIEDRIKYFV